MRCNGSEKNAFVVSVLYFSVYKMFLIISELMIHRLKASHHTRTPSRPGGFA